MVDKVTRAKQQRSIATRETLLDAAGKVFSQRSYADARLKEISEEAGISQGSLYFHFGNKENIAAAVLEAMQDQMAAVLTQVLDRPGSGLNKILDLCQELAELIASRPVVQGGILLSTQMGTGLETLGRDPYFEWVKIARSLLELGVEDGSIDTSVDVALAAEFVNQVFVGVQVLSGLADSWQSMPERMTAASRYITAALASDRLGS